MILLQLFFEFLKVGLFTIGGGLASLPFLYDIAERTNWYTTVDIMNMIAISESTPGPIGINMATYIGYSVSGPLGGLVATLGFITIPAILVICIAGALNKVKDNKYFNYAFYGLRPTVTALIAVAFIDVSKVVIFNSYAVETASILGKINIMALIVALAVYALIVKFNRHPIVYISGCAVLGILLNL